MSAAHQASGRAARVTAVVPLKNFHEPYLREAIASLQGQTCPDWRGLVVVEPEDVDQFEGLLAAELADERLSLIANEGRGLAGAINTGIRQATTDFIAILLADDAWSTDAIEVLNRNVEAHPEVEFFHSARRVVDDDGQPRSGVLPPLAKIDMAAFAWTSQVKHLMCFQREKALAVGALDERNSGVGPDDYDFPWTMADHGACFRPVAECLYIYRDHRRAYRLTTHLPLSVHTRELVRILRRHGVPWSTTIHRVLRARRGYLKQCLYRSPVDRWLRERLGLGPRAWMQDYPK